MLTSPTEQTLFENVKLSMERLSIFCIRIRAITVHSLSCTCFSRNRCFKPVVVKIVFCFIFHQTLLQEVGNLFHYHIIQTCSLSFLTKTHNNEMHLAKIYFEFLFFVHKKKQNEIKGQEYVQYCFFIRRSEI